jgi:ferric-dicitrate binding protein FerR (iron transport regulator)
MSLNASQRNEIERIVARATAGDADEQDCALLDELLRESAEARAFYLQLMDLQSSLIWRGGVPCPVRDDTSGLGFAVIEKALRLNVSEAEESLVTPLDPPIASTARFSGRAWKFSVAAAAVIFCAAMVYQFVGGEDRATAPLAVEQAPSNPNPRTASALLAKDSAEASKTVRSTTPATSVGVARLTGTWDALWAGPGNHSKSGEALSPGKRLELAGGLAEVTFECGAVVIVQAPAVFEVKSAHGGTLERGRLTARVPGPWAKFWVETPQAKIFDLGTEFGISADAEGASQVRVFEGAVEVEPNRTVPASPAANSRHLLTAGQAGRIEDGGDVRLPGIATEPSSAYVRSMPNSLVEDFVRSIQSSRPWGYWSFNSVITSTLVPDVSGHGYFGQLFGNAMVVQGGSIVAIGQAASFQGPGDAVVVPTGTSFSLRKDFTLEALFRTSMGGVLISKAPSDGSWKAGSKVLFVRGGEVRFTPFDGGKNRKAPMLSARVLVNDGQWHHVVLTNRANVKGRRDHTVIYVDGVERTRRTDWDITSADDSNLPLKLGVGADSYPTSDVLKTTQFPTRNNLIGHIDEAAVYDRCLAVEEIEGHYRAYLTAGIARRAMAPATDSLQVISPTDEATQESLEEAEE